MRFEKTLMIRSSPDEVFAYLADFENVPRWNYAIVETRKLSEGPIRVGARYLQKRSLPFPSEETFVVTEFKPEHRVAIQGDLGPFEATLSYEVHGVSDGTELTHRAELEGKGLARVAAPFLGSRVGDAVAANLQKLKEILEASAP